MEFYISLLLSGNVNQIDENSLMAALKIFFLQMLDSYKVERPKKNSFGEAENGTGKSWKGLVPFSNLKD